MQINTGIITISDRASKGLYDDLGGPALKKAAEGYGWKVLAEALVPDEKRDIQRAIREQIAKSCHLILTTGGTGVAVRDLAQRRAVRPKNMAPSATASPCVFADDTFYCSAKSAFIPPNEGIYIPTVEGQMVMSMRSQLDSLDEVDLKPANIVSVTLYLDNLSDLPKSTDVLGRYFPSKSVTGSTVAQVAPREQGGQQPDSRGRFPSLEQFSLIAVK